jgi:hypothetical protein
MHPVTSITQDATRLAMIHALAAQARAHRSQLRAIHAVATLMRSPATRWSKIAHWVALVKHFEDSEKTHQAAADYFRRSLNQLTRKTQNPQA